MQSTKFFTLTGVMSSQSDFDKINEMYLWSYDIDLNLLFWQSLQSVVCTSIVLYHLFSLFSSINTKLSYFLWSGCHL